jgi:signal transduction histidine kinase
MTEYMLHPAGLLRSRASQWYLTGDRGLARGATTSDESLGRLSGWLVSAALVAAVTGVLLALDGHAPVSSLMVLYVLAVLPVAIGWGVVHGVVVSVASAATFDFLFVPPRYSVTPADARNWIGLAALLGTAVVAGRLAARSRERAREVEQIFTLSMDLLASAMARDATERRRSEDRLREAQRMVEASRDELAGSRARIVAATDQERRRVVRDLHDGAQQRLVHTIITLKLARRALDNEDDAAPALVNEALDQAESANVELRELVRGILPTVLSQGGLHAGVEALASRAPVPVRIDVSVGRLATAVEATAYFVVAEALTNVAKHARAEHAEVMAQIKDGTLAIQVRDDGMGGARPEGSGLVGLADRLAALDGRLRVESPTDGGTLIAAAIPLAGSPRRLRS